jgi:hypothetical protein
MKQAYPIAGSILDYSQKESVKYWFNPSISQPAVSQHLERADWGTIEAGLVYFERAVRAQINEVNDRCLN